MTMYNTLSKSSSLFSLVVDLWSGVLTVPFAATEELFNSSLGTANEEQQGSSVFLCSW